ncbi:MAG: energy transducer TonB [Bacteroidia bacterium]
MRIIQPIIFCILLCSTISTISVAQETDTAQSAHLVEVPPEFPGGEDALYKYIGENLVYPRRAKKKNIVGSVVVTFVIERDGSISSIKVLKSPHRLLSKETIRLVEGMPKWTPGYQRGDTVRVQFVLPIRYKLT